MDEMNRAINDIMQQGEEDLKEKIKPLTDHDGFECELCKNNFINEISPELQFLCRKKGEEVAKYSADNPTNTDVIKIIQEKIKYIVEQITPKMSNAFINNYVSEIDAKINTWRFEQKILLQQKLELMIPNEPYYSPFNADKVILTPEEGRNQAAIIANIIANTVYDKLLEIYHATGFLPDGGYLGNYRSALLPDFLFWGKSKHAQMQCQDWTDLIYNALTLHLESYFKSNLNSFQMNWHTKIPFLGYPSDKSFFQINWGEHNWIRIIEPNRKSEIMIDPWKTGGRHLLEKDYEDNKILKFLFGERTHGYHFGDVKDDRVKIVPTKKKIKGAKKK